jgi:hypothetical protein
MADACATFTALLLQFGGKNGMIADPDWGAISQYADELSRLGFGFSAVEIATKADDESAKEMLRDWGWSASDPTPDWW